jgi:hypothetical protein
MPFMDEGQHFDYGSEELTLGISTVAAWFTAIDRGKRTRRMDSNAAFSEIARVNSRCRAS